MDRRNIIPTVFWYDIGSVMDWRLTRDGIPVVFSDGRKVTEEMEKFARFLRREGFDIEDAEASGRERGLQHHTQKIAH
jgi:hypothetical protein